MTRLDAIVRRIAVSLSIAGAWSATLLAVWAQEAVPPQWVGEYQKPGTGVQATQEKDQTAKLLVYGGGLPGAGWDRQAVRQVELEIDEVERFLKDLAVEKVVRSSPTLGAQPPIGAKVLFDGSQASLKEQWEAGAKVDADGSLVAGATTQERFGDYRLHLEFQIPWMPDASGQGRGNSGVYHQGRYETQVLDSFGMENLPDGCGAIYAVKPAQFNASLPPGTWQTYDIEFQAARWDAQGKKISDARLTVDLNGQRVHTAEPVPGSTRAAPLGEDANAGPIHLQDHGNPVKYRNIWVVPFDSRKEELRPRVAGYERFPEGWDTQGDPHAAGRLLVGELGCVRCHSPGALEPSLFPKEAPRLDLVSSRLKAPWVEAYLKDPASVHPGATMPDLLNGKDAGDRATIAKELTAYLFESSRPMRGALADSNASARGKQLYETTGCLVCHGEQQEAGSSRGLVPLPVIADKYRVEGLVSFLLNPHQTRPSGRMPSMRLSEQEARDVALYLIPQGQESQLQPNVRFEAFEGSWERLPDFSKLKAYRQGTTAGFDLREAQRTNQFAMRFEGYLELASDGEYQFTIGSDDGSRLKIDGESIVDVDGVHPHQTRAGSRRLAAGIHRVEVEYFQGGGEWTLQLDWEGPGVERQPLAESLRVDQKPVAKPVEDVEATKRLAAKGKQWFGSLGCIQCHALDRANEEPAKVQANLVPLDRASVDRGCLAATPAPGVPNYRLTQRQRESIAGALRENGVPTNGTDRSTVDQIKWLHQRMVALQCTQCHQRNTVGGPELTSLAAFQSTTPEMGDEGRLPPALNGAGDKLRDEYLDRILREGAKDRPAMLTRMPAYHDATSGMRDALIAIDRKPDSEEAKETAADPKMLAAGRQLVGSKGLACVQCHGFGERKSLGIPSLSLLAMPERVRKDWFVRYMLHPTAYRPGTRMPASFPEGKSVLTSIYDGDGRRQIDAIWQFLKQGSQAAIPEGLMRDQIVLEPIDRPILYRNFLEGMSPRGIAVGFPQGVHGAWDAEWMHWRWLWQNQFIDASLHWRDRGVGRQKPLGDNLLAWEDRSPLARLDKPEDPWPADSARQRGAQFLGYQLDSAGVPTFRYRMDGLLVEDRMQPVDGQAGTMTRMLRITREGEATTDESVEKKCYYRWLQGDSLAEIQPGVWKDGERWRVEWQGNLPLLFRSEQGGRTSVLLELPELKAGQSIEWQWQVQW